MSSIFKQGHYLLVIILLLSSNSLFGQVIPNGDYHASGGVISKVKVLNRYNGTIRATLSILQREKKDLIFSPIKNQKGIYELQGESKNMVLVSQGGVIGLFELDDSNVIKDKIALGINKKELKEAKKKLRIKSSLSKELGGFVKKKKAQKKAPEYFVKRPTSDFHKKNVGKIVFFSKEPTVGKEDLSTLKASFTMGEPIWAVAYLPAPLKQSRELKRLTNSFYDAYGNWNYWLTIGMDKSEKDMLPKENEVVNQCTVKTLYETDLDKNYVVFQVVPSGISDMKMDKGGAKFLLGRMGERLGDNEHKIRVSLTDGDMEQEEELFVGHFNYDATGGADKLISMSKSLEKEIMKAHKLPSAVMKDAGIEIEMLSHIKLWAKRKNSWSDVKFTRVIITMDWRVLKDDYGNIEGKYIEGNVLYSSDEGCAHRNFGFIRKYLGGGQYATQLTQHTTGATYPLSCDKIK